MTQINRCLSILVLGLSLSAWACDEDTSTQTPDNGNEVSDLSDVELQDDEDSLPPDAEELDAVESSDALPDADLDAELELPQDLVDGSDSEPADTSDSIEELDGTELPGLELCGQSTLEVEQLFPSASEVSIHLLGDHVESSSSAVTSSDGQVLISAPGIYRISGTLHDGQLVVEYSGKELVALVLDGVEITCSDDAAIDVRDAGRCLIYLAEGSNNHVTDGQSYLPSSEANAAIHVKSELLLAGSGRLRVDARFNDGIAGKDGVFVLGGEYEIHALDDGLRGKDFLVIADGSFVIDAEADALKSDNEEDPSLGFVCIEGGHFELESGSDGIQAETQLLASGGNFVIAAGGGSSASLASDASAKGLKAGSLVQLSGGSFDLNCADDAIHSDDAIVIENGSFQLRTADDAVHGEESLSILGGEFEISTSYEGIESKELLIEGGQIRVLSSDDGVNGAGGVDGSGGPPGPPPQGDYWLHITGGRLVVNARGDGIDVNGSIEMSDGVVLVNGPTEAMNGPLDYDRSFNISGGTLIAVGSSNMAQAPSTSSAQNSILLRSNTTRQAGTLIHLRTASGTELFTFKPEKAFQSVVFSSPALVNGSYSLYFGGGHSGSEEDGLYTGGSYTPGTLYRSFNVSARVTTLN